jgi:DNA-binding transcriptional LysR family regulator
MLDGVSLDQLRSFIAAADEGSFSAASRKLRRVQSAVSEWIGGLEGQLRVTLFDRSNKYPTLTPEGVVLLADARAIVAAVDRMKARAKLVAGGLEPELSIVVDVFFPMAEIADAAKDFEIRFPYTPLRIYVEALGAAYLPLFDKRCSLGFLGSLPLTPPTFEVERLFDIPLVMVASPNHPLAELEGVIPKTELAKHVQLVLTDRSDLSAGKDYGIMSPQTWRLGDLYAKHLFLKNNLGWGGMPKHAVDEDLAEGRLVILQTYDVPAEGLMLPMSAMYLASDPPGPAGRWLIDRLKKKAA